MDKTKPETDITYDFNPENPVSLLLFIRKYAKVQLIKDTLRHGYIHSIDPTSKSVVLLSPHEDGFRICLIPGHAILEVTVLKDKPYYRSSSYQNQTSDCDITIRKLKILSWLKENLLPVTESDENIVCGNVLILPPYGITDICTDNPMVAMQIMNIMKKMPDNYEPVK